ncbi:MAG: hypothetical protein HY393_03065 [Candidatus Diapherotrites archaeon]|nr:hypothetical protein [Candidatus Diapherotrites archaeon]
MPKKPSLFKAMRLRIRRVKFLQRASQLFGGQPLSINTVKDFERAHEALEPMVKRIKGRYHFTSHAHAEYAKRYGARHAWKELSKAQQERVARAFIEAGLPNARFPAQASTPLKARPPYNRETREGLIRWLAYERGFYKQLLKDKMKAVQPRVAEHVETRERNRKRMQNLFTLYKGIIEGLRTGRFKW